MRKNCSKILHYFSIIFFFIRSSGYEKLEAEIITNNEMLLAWSFFVAFGSHKRRFAFDTFFRLEIRKKSNLRVFKLIVFSFHTSTSTSQLFSTSLTAVKLQVASDLLFVVSSHPNLHFYPHPHPYPIRSVYIHFLVFEKLTRRESVL